MLPAGVATSTPGVQPDGSLRQMGRRSQSTSALRLSGESERDARPPQEGQVTVRIQLPTANSPRGVDRIQAVQNQVTAVQQAVPAQQPAPRRLQYSEMSGPQLLTEVRTKLRPLMGIPLGDFLTFGPDGANGLPTDTFPGLFPVDGNFFVQDLVMKRVHQVALWQMYGVLRM